MDYSSDNFAVYLITTNAKKYTMSEKISRHPRLNEVAYKELKEKIITGEFLPGFRLKEEFLVKMFGISKTPIKLAIAKLEQDGLVVTLPRRGSYVSEINEETIKEIFSLREVLYSLAVKLAVSNISDEDFAKLEKVHLSMADDIENISLKDYIQGDNLFHHMIIEYSGNRLLRECLNPIINRIEMLKYQSALSKERRKQACREHAKIVDAFRKNNPRAAETAMKEHLDNSMNAVKTTIAG
ncbi:hypothetical protein X474_22275 [Dethiosulfatarculus sandiegensis]|uniref:HTH gntR-type domain-containing protein n=2 Tax=Dethiosulfatarculus sandiegensis TaxID=1429043 RepID=A0A0D2JQM1_9BACT|nr:hypothetical protein X474_22275 [Dethiosulfatarculus sandiegensis]